MALFGKKKAAETKVEEEVKTKKVASTKTKTVKAKKADDKVMAVKPETVKAKKSEAAEKIATGKSEYSYRVTEKATRLADKNVYVLNVPKETNKTELKKVLETKYKVHVLGINMVNSPKKARPYKGRMGMRAGGKKAYITLKAGESIVL